MATIYNNYNPEGLNRMLLVLLQYNTIHAGLQEQLLSRMKHQKLVSFGYVTYPLKGNIPGYSRGQMRRRQNILD